MKVKSNISVASNIYIKSTNLENDVDFVKNVKGYKALKKLESRLSGTLIKAKLNRAQRQEIKSGGTCSKAKNNEITHGKVMKNGRIRWEGRCEYDKCPRYSRCPESRSGLRINRAREPQAVRLEEIDFDRDEYTYLGIDLNNDDFKEILSADESIYEDLREEYNIENKDIIIMKTTSTDINSAVEMLVISILSSKT